MRRTRFSIEVVVTMVVLLGLAITLAGCRPSAAKAEGEPEATTTTILNKGSDTLVNLALAWAEAYAAEHPDIRISVTGGGSGTGIAALINHTVDLANASREMKEEEI